MPAESIQPVYDNVPGNVYDKYGTPNPVARRLVSNFIRQFTELAHRTEARHAFEVGCGEGALSLELLRRGWSVHGVDLEKSVIDMANASAEAEGFGARFRAADLYTLTRKEAGAPLVICCEVLEHTPDPWRALDVLTDLADPWLLLSVPREPLWRLLNMARGKYLADLGNTPGHIQHWSRKSFVAMVSGKAEIVEIRAPLPWTMVLCRCR